MRFYNPGLKISEMLPYTNTAKDPRDGNTISYHLMNAPERGFFELPEVITLMTDEGEATIPVGFGRVVKRDFANRGVIHIDSRRKAEDILDDDNTAEDDDAARKKGARLWKGYLLLLVNEHFARVQDIKAYGNVPRPAQGTTLYALKKLDMDDPADTVDTIIRAKEGQVTNLNTQAQITALRDQLNQLIGANNERNPTEPVQATLPESK